MVHILVKNISCWWVGTLFSENSVGVHQRKMLMSLNTLECFVAKMYLPSSETLSLDDVRFSLFSNSVNENFRKLPPSKDGLLQHVLRSAFQAGWVWGNTFHQKEIPCKVEWHWNFHAKKQQLCVTWCTSSSANLLARITSTCKCRSTNPKWQSYKFGKQNMACLTFCACK